MVFKTGVIPKQSDIMKVIYFVCFSEETIYALNKIGYGRYEVRL